AGTLPGAVEYAVVTLLPGGATLTGRKKNLSDVLFFLLPGLKPKNTPPPFMQTVPHQSIKHNRPSPPM
ncbi:hypothetical protein ACVGWL_00285, partial [Enterobacter asburiae]